MWTMSGRRSMPHTRTNGPLTPSQCAKIQHQFEKPLRQSRVCHSLRFFSSDCDLCTSLDTLSSHSVSTFNQVSDAFSRGHDPITLARRARCLARVGSIFSECSRCPETRSSSVQDKTDCERQTLVGFTHVSCHTTDTPCLVKRCQERAVLCRKAENTGIVMQRSPAHTYLGVARPFRGMPVSVRSVDFILNDFESYSDSESICDFRFFLY